MGNNTSTPSPEGVRTELDEVLHCIGNSSIWAGHLNTPRNNLSARSQHAYPAVDATLARAGVIAGVLLLFCALLAGLTLAICGLDDTLLRLRTATGTVKERKHAAVVDKMKRHGTWMLCSLILCSCACGETFPFLIQALCQTLERWLAVLISTLCLAIIAEILPQYIIPRNAIAWGYYCWPVVWGCMILTSPISWPIAWLLNALFGKAHQDKCGIFSNGQLEELIRHHDESANKGGQLGRDAARVAIGALKLDSRTIGAELIRVIAPVPESEERDIEKTAEIIVPHGLIIKWSAVKTIKIDDFVDQAFLRKVKGWSYSRIPVISKAEIGPWVGDEKNLQGGMEGWDGTRIYGFLHTRNLISLELKPGLRVKDLPLYPLPIVRESMSVYELLNMFQLGISRMAIVVANRRHDPLHRAEITPSVFHDPAEFSTMRWTATKRTNENIVSKMRERENEKIDGINEFLSSEGANVMENGYQQNVYGIRAPKPVGIITFEDIIDTILQKTSRDEKDFFSRGKPTLPTKAKKAGDYTTKTSTRDLSPLGSLPPISVPKARMSPKTSIKDGTLRFRSNYKNHKAISNLDGTNETKEVTSVACGKATRPSAREVRSESSYTENSNGGFHGSNRTTGSVQSRRLTAADIANLTVASPCKSPNDALSQAKSTSLPSRNKKLKEIPKISKHLWRNVSASPALPGLQLYYTPNPTRKQMVTFDGVNNRDEDTSSFVMPEPSTEVAFKKELTTSPDNNTSSNLDNYPEIKGQHGSDESGETILTHSSWCESYYENENRFDSEIVYDALPAMMQKMQDRNFLASRDGARDLDTITEERSTTEEDLRPYEGFPAELLYRSNENRVPNYLSFTLPRIPEMRRDFTPIRENSFEDDRALLPSQRKTLQVGMGMDVATRCSSLWF